MVLPNSLSSYYEKFLTTGEVKCIDEEIPFEIPKGWEWTRIRNISQSYIGLTYSPTDVSSRGTIVLRSSNIQNGKIVLNDVVRVSKEISEKLQVEKNDIIICARNGSAKLVGKSAVVTDVTEPMTFGAFMAICKTALYQYVSIFLQSDLFFSQLRGVSGTTTINQLTQNNFNDFWIPIPPANEQKRIVEKLQNVSPFIERYSKSQETLNLMNIQIKEQLKKSILQEAIQGKLVPQIAEEGTAQELLEQIRQEKQKLVQEGNLKKSVLTDSVIYKGDDNKYWEKYGTETICVNDEIPFEIPATWIWVRLDNICSYIQRGKSPKYSPIKKYPVIAQKCNQWAGFCIDKAQFIDPNSLPSYSEERLLQDGDLMWNSTGLGTLGRMAIYQSALNPYELAVADSHVTVIRPLKEHILSQYLYYYFASDTVQSVIEDKSDGSTKQKELSTTTVKNYLVPIPPYREQQRIVEKIKTVTSIMRG